MAHLNDIRERLKTLENQVVGEGGVLSEEQQEEARQMRLSLNDYPEEEVGELHDMLSRIGDASSRHKNVRFDAYLEEEYGRLDEEFRNPDTTPERREEILKQQRPISELIRMRGR